MRVFVTGATGYVGRAVAEAFRRRGHRVAGLARGAERRGRACAACSTRPGSGRAEHEKKVLAAGGVVIRPGCVYGRAGGLTGIWFKGAAESGIEGELFNATDRSRFTVREMAEAAARAAGKGGAVKDLPFVEPALRRLRGRRPALLRVLVGGPGGLTARLTA